MSKKVYRSAQGKTIDIGTLQLQNESVKAVGNMGVNARGDKVNDANSTVESRTKNVAKHYKKQVNRTNVSDDVVVPSKRAATNVAKQTKPDPEPVEELELDMTVVEHENAPVVEEPVEQTTPAPKNKNTKSKPVGGLADAIAKAKNVKQEPLKTPRQQAQEKKGVKRI